MIRYYGLHVSRRRGLYCILLEYADRGSLADALRKLRSGQAAADAASGDGDGDGADADATPSEGGLPLRSVAHVTRQVLQGLAYLHAQKIIHRDIKPDNILWTSAGRVKIADFDISTQVVGARTLQRSCVGTPHYTAPEVLMLEPYSAKADIWSLGCTVLELATGRRPYAGLNGVQAMFRMVRDARPPVPRRWTAPGLVAGGPCALLRDFLFACWTKDHAARPSAAELLTHPFVTQLTAGES